MPEERGDAIAVQVSHISGVVVLDVVGQIDLTTVGVLRDALTLACDERVVVLSLVQVKYMDSTTLSALAVEHKQRSERGCRILVVFPAQSVAAKLFNLTGLVKVLDCFSDLDKAIEEARLEQVEHGSEKAS